MSVPKLEHVTIDIDSEAIAVIKYNRPGNANAIHTPLLKDVLSALQWANSTPQIRIIITTGEGKFYTAGLDLLDPINQGPAGETISDEFIQTIGKIHEALIKTPKLVISAVNGPAPGWGTSSIALSDLVYTVPGAVFFTPFVQWGLCAEGCSSYTFMRAMGRQKASGLILAGQRLTAQEMESAGLVTKILDAENFKEEVLGLARGIARLPPKTLVVNKELMMRGQRESLLEANEIELKTLKEQVAKEESKSAVRGFVEETERKKKAKQAKL